MASRGRSGRLERVNVQIDAALRAELAQQADRLGESVSTFFRESARERLDRLKRAELDRSLREAYVAMADENVQSTKVFEAVDLEGWE